MKATQTSAGVWMFENVDEAVVITLVEGVQGQIRRLMKELRQPTDADYSLEDQMFYHSHIAELQRFLFVVNEEGNTDNRGVELVYTA